MGARQRSVHARSKGISRCVLWLSLCGTQLACAQASERQLSSALGILDGARAQAERYVPEALVRAEELLDLAKAELEAQKERTAILRSYSKLRQLTREAEIAVHWVRREAVLARARTRRAAQRALHGARTSIDAAVDAFQQAPRGGDMRADLIRMRRDIDALAVSLQRAEKASARGEFAHAAARAEAVEYEARRVARTIELAVEHLPASLRRNVSGATSDSENLERPSPAL